MAKSYATITWNDVTIYEGVRAGMTAGLEELYQQMARTLFFLTPVGDADNPENRHLNTSIKYELRQRGFYVAGKLGFINPPVNRSGQPYAIYVEKGTYKMAPRHMLLRTYDQWAPLAPLYIRRNLRF